MSQFVDITDMTAPEVAADGLWLALWGPEGGASRGVAGLGPAPPGRTGPAGYSTRLTLARPYGRATPALAQDETTAVIFDGILYNASDLHAQLGVAATDSTNAAEIVLQIYRRAGSAAGRRVLRAVKGIFALIIWDAKRDVLICARDPLGVHPLFYASRGPDLLLSPAIEILVQQVGVPTTLNRAVLADHLCHRWQRLDETYYEAIRRVPPGHLLERAHGLSRVARYWHPVPAGDPGDAVREDDLPQFDVLFAQAVARAMTLGPAGILLSGGLDSASVAAVAADTSRHAGQPLPVALSCLFSGEDCNEEAIQRGVADRLGLPQEMVPFAASAGDDGVLRASVEMSRNWPVPMFNVYFPFHRYLGRAARARGCRVILTGGGGDEWLGVSPYHAAELIRTGRPRGLLALANQLEAVYPLPRQTILRLLMWHFGLRVIIRDAGAHVLRRMAPGVYRGLRYRGVAAATPPWIAPDPSLRRELDRRVGASRLAVQPGMSHVRDNEAMLDHPLMAMDMEDLFVLGGRLGLRLLQPFWDADLVAFLFRTPPELLSRGGQAKGLLRQTLSRRFPDFGFERQQKTSVLSFFESMMQREGPGAWAALGGVPALAALGLVDRRGVEDYVGQVFAGTRLAADSRLWALLSLEAWTAARS